MGQKKAVTCYISTSYGFCLYTKLLSYNKLTLDFAPRFVICAACFRPGPGKGRLFFCIVCFGANKENDERSYILKVFKQITPRSPLRDALL